LVPREQSQKNRYAKHYKSLILALRLAAVHNSKIQNPRLVADTLVVELAALFHDFFDSKYKSATSEDELDVSSWLDDNGVAKSRADLIIKVISNISYRKEVSLRETGGWTSWHDSCIELHCVMDADKLDALGAYGILRCAAFSGVRNFPLYVSEVGNVDKNSAIGHFDEKLFKLEGMMMTDLGRQVARGRSTIMKNFVKSLEAEEQLLDF
jgi:uncharacterized protein